MGSFPRAEMIEDDVEAQHQHSDWLSRVQHTLRVDQEEVEDKLGFCVLKVPEHFRRPPEEYTPVVWRLGLHNLENLNTTGSEALKLNFAVALGLVGQKWVNFCDSVVDDAKSIIICYGLHEEVSCLSEQVIKQVLALDALFLAVRMDMRFSMIERQLWTADVMESNPTTSQIFNSRFERWGYFKSKDICKIEDQVPFVLIEELFSISENLQMLNPSMKISQPTMQMMDNCIVLMKRNGCSSQ